MSGLGGLNKAPDGVVIGLVQIAIARRRHAGQTSRGRPTASSLVGKARRNWRPWISWFSRNIRCTACRWTPIRRSCAGSTGPRSRTFAAPASTIASGAASRSWSSTRDGNPYNTGLIIDDRGEHQALLPQAASLGAGRAVGARQPRHSRCATGRTAAKLALIICHDGMFPEMARECAYKGADIMIRTAGYTAPIRQSWHFTNQSNAFCNLMYTASVCMCGSDGSFDSMGEGMIVELRRHAARHGTAAAPTRSSPPRSAPTWCARRASIWGVENNIYQFGHRGYVAVKGGARDCPYTYMHDLAAGTYRLPWEDQVKVTDGTSCGFPAPTRMFGKTAKAAE